MYVNTVYVYVHVESNVPTPNKQRNDNLATFNQIDPRFLRVTSNFFL